jgi:hypothetical protein
MTACTFSEVSGPALLLRRTDSLWCTFLSRFALRFAIEWSIHRTEHLHVMFGNAADIPVGE